MKRVINLLSAVAERDSILVGDMLKSQVKNSVGQVISQQIQLSRPSDTAHHTLFINFDKALIWNPANVPVVSDLFEYLLETRSMHRFLSYTLRKVVNELTKSNMFRM